MTRKYCLVLLIIAVFLTACVDEGEFTQYERIKKAEELEADREYRQAEKLYLSLLEEGVSNELIEEDLLRNLESFYLEIAAYDKLEKIYLDRMDKTEDPMELGSLSNSLANIYKRSGNYEKEESILLKMEEYEGRYIHSEREEDLMKIYYKTLTNEDYIKKYEAFIDRKYYNEAVFFDGIKTYEELGEIEKAYEKIERLSPNSINSEDSFLQLVNFYARQGDYKNIEKLLADTRTNNNLRSLGNFTDYWLENLKEDYYIEDKIDFLDQEDRRKDGSFILLVNKDRSDYLIYLLDDDGEISTQEKFEGEFDEIRLDIDWENERAFLINIVKNDRNRVLAYRLEGEKIIFLDELDDDFTVEFLDDFKISLNHRESERDYILHLLGDSRKVAIEKAYYDKEGNLIDNSMGALTEEVWYKFRRGSRTYFAVDIFLDQELEDRLGRFTVAYTLEEDQFKLDEIMILDGEENITLEEKIN